MGLQLRDGSNWWYGRWQVEGKSVIVPLHVPVRGNRPRCLSDKGDVKFERSRRLAAKRLEELRDQSQTKARQEDIVQRIYEIRNGSRLQTLPIGELPDAWAGLDRRQRLSPSYELQGHRHLTRFVNFVRKQYPQAEDLLDVTPAVAESFMRSEDGRSISAKTYNSVLVLLRSAFKNVGAKHGITHNPFSPLHRKTESPVFRQPFSPEEVALILKACERDDFARPIIVTGICTAMRRRDCCMLMWDAVDLDAGYVRVITSKTKEPVLIPVFPPLRQELLLHGPRTKGYTYPEQAQAYLRNPTLITDAVKTVLGRIGFWESRSRGYVGMKSDLSPGILSEDQRALIRHRILNMPLNELTVRRKDDLLAVLDLYSRGSNINEVRETTGLSKGSVSRFLNIIEDIAGVPVIRGKLRMPPDERFRGTTQLERKQGQRRATIRDFHAFRTTWVTIALTAGVPMDLVRLVTGHRTVEVVLRHYFHPQQKQLRDVLFQRMPSVFTGSTTDSET